MRFNSFTDFYPYYLSEHQNLTCRRLHFLGSILVLVSIVLAVVFSNPLWLVAALLSGYGFAWIGHFFFEHNKPATFQYPIYSLMGDWVMFWQILVGKVSLSK